MAPDIKEIIQWQNDFWTKYAKYYENPNVLVNGKPRKEITGFRLERTTPENRMARPFA